MKNEIINLSKKLKIDLIGFTDLKCEDIIKDKYKLQQELGYKCSFQVGDIEDKLLTSEKYKDYNTAVVIGISYPKIETDKIHLSSCSWGQDYHTVLKSKLDVIGRYLEENNYNYKIFVDNNAIDERYIAYKAGLGFFGKNNLLINEEYGSYFFIGVLLTSFICEYDKPTNTTCKGCNLCIKNCPTKALSEKGILNQNKCLSYLTQKKDLNEEECTYLNNCIYGCDICQKVCPHNQNIHSNNFIPIGNEIINKDEFLNMSTKDYKERYKNNSCSWRKKAILDRNIKEYCRNKSNK